MRKEGIVIKKTGSRAPPTISFPVPVLVPALPLASSSDPEAATRFLAPATLGLSVDPSANQLALPGSFPACGLCGLAIPRHYVLNHGQLKGHRLSYQLLLGPVDTVLELEVIYCVAMPPSE